MTEYHDSASESVVVCGIAPKGWKLLRSSEKRWRFRITVYHTNLDIRVQYRTPPRIQMQNHDIQSCRKHAVPYFLEFYAVEVGCPTTTSALCSCS